MATFTPEVRGTKNNSHQSAALFKKKKKVELLILLVQSDQETLQPTDL